MNAEDEVFLTAYLDGELESEHRQRVEAAMVSDARLLDHVHAIAAVREMVASLPRPTVGPDVSNLVIAAIDRRRAGVFQFRALSVRAGWIAAAAVVLLAVFLAGPQPKESAPVVRQHQTPIPQALVDRPVESVLEKPPPLVAAFPKPEPVSTPLPALTETDRARDADQLQVRELLDRAGSEPPRMLVIKGSPATGAPDKVAELLEKSSLRNARFGRFTISQGIQIDPDRPGEATVFAVVMDESELREFRTTLKNTTTLETVVEMDARPEVVTQLVDVSEISLAQAQAVAGLKVREGPTRAIQEEPRPGAIIKKSELRPDGAFVRQNDKETGKPLVSSRDESLPATASKSSERPIAVDRPADALVLIWVTSFSFRDPRMP